MRGLDYPAPAQSSAEGLLTRRDADRVRGRSLRTGGKQRHGSNRSRGDMSRAAASFRHFPYSSAGVVKAALTITDTRSAPTAPAPILHRRLTKAASIVPRSLELAVRSHDKAVT